MSVARVWRDGLAAREWRDGFNEGYGEGCRDSSVCVVEVMQSFLKNNDDDHEVLLLREVLDSLMDKLDLSKGDDEKP